ncbi:unnamed protein product [Cercospora beticola]|nr:unnamed protein product [Cercospora beticola]
MHTSLLSILLPCLSWASYASGTYGKGGVCQSSPYRDYSSLANYDPAVKYCKETYPGKTIEKCVTKTITVTKSCGYKNGYKQARDAEAEADPKYYGSSNSKKWNQLRKDRNKLKTFCSCIGYPKTKTKTSTKTYTKTICKPTYPTPYPPQCVIPGQKCTPGKSKCCSNSTCKTKGSETTPVCCKANDAICSLKDPGACCGNTCIRTDSSKEGEGRCSGEIIPPPTCSAFTTPPATCVSRRGRCCPGKDSCCDTELGVPTTCQLPFGGSQPVCCSAGGTPCSLDVDYIPCCSGVCSTTEENREGFCLFPEDGEPGSP